MKTEVIKVNGVNIVVIKTEEYKKVYQNYDEETLTAIFKKATKNSDVYRTNMLLANKNLYIFPRKNNVDDLILLRQLA